MRFKTGLLVFLFILMIPIQIIAIEPVPHPNPWRYGINGSANGGLDFYVRADATQAVLKIYNLGGDLVRDLKVTDLAALSSGVITWNGHNDMGWLVSSGVYFYYIEVTFPGTTGSQTENYTGKLVFIN